jgi:DNA-binding NarL/FixJ family response regulator
MPAGSLRAKKAAAIVMTELNSASMAPPRCVLIADDHEMVRVGMRVLIGDLFAEATIIEASSLAGIEQALADHADCDLAMVDLNMPGMEGVQTIRRLREAHAALKLVVISGIESPSEMLACLDEGANGFIEKAAPGRIVEQALALVLAGGTYVPPGAVGKHRPAPAAPRPEVTSAAPGTDALTPRQREVLQHLSLGKSNKEIARELELSEGTVKIHVTAILKALGARSRGHAIVLASQAMKA